MAQNNPLADLISYFVRKNRSPEKKAALANRLAELLRQKGISCHCGGLAIPVETKGKIYRCTECERQFANTAYDLSKYEACKPEFYTEAVKILKNK